MRISIMIIALLGVGPAIAGELQSIQFEAASGETVEAEMGRFTVPAHHEEPDDAVFELAYVRFASTSANPGHPIVYLAGGPGGSGIATAKGDRFALFMALREIADVIALDQRGTGQSSPPPRCETNQRYGFDRPILRDDVLEYMRARALECEAWWREQGVDLAAFNSWESAGDLEALRRELGAEKLTLWGISYGTHLAQAALKRMPERIDKVMLASPEGLDQTVKLPARSDEYFQRLSAVIAADPQAAAAFPDVVPALRGLLADLDQRPVTVEVQPAQGMPPVKLTFDATPLRFYLAFFGVKNPQDAARLPAFVHGLEQGDFLPLARIAAWIAGQPTSFDAMSLAMDVASGVSEARLEQVRAQATTALVGDMLNFPMPHFIGLLDIPVLPDSFRVPLESDVPALILTGTLDGRTFPEAHAEVLSQFSRGRQIVIENAGHDLFMVSPEVTEAIVAFARGEETPDRITIAPPEFKMP